MKEMLATNQKQVLSSMCSCTIVMLSVDRLHGDFAYVIVDIRFPAKIRSEFSNIVFGATTYFGYLAFEQSTPRVDEGSLDTDIADMADLAS